VPAVPVLEGNAVRTSCDAGPAVPVAVNVVEMLVDPATLAFTVVTPAILPSVKVE